MSDSSEEVRLALSSAGIKNLDRAEGNLQMLRDCGMPDDLFWLLWRQLKEHLGDTSDPDMALNNLERFILAARSAQSIGALFDRDRTGLPILLTIFSTSQYLSDQLIRDTESYDYLRMTEGQLHARHTLVDELTDEMRSAQSDTGAMQILRRFKHRETLRIAFGDIIVQQKIRQVTEQISWVAEAISEAALQYCVRCLDQKYGRPLNRKGDRCRYVIIAMGKLGGTELNYSSDIDLVMVYEEDGVTENNQDNGKYFERLTRDFTKLLTETTKSGAAYRVDLRLRPEGSKGRICNPARSLLRYYDLQGRTWERQALIKARSIAGDLELGNELIEKLQPWIYRRLVNQLDISSIKALKRQIERRALVAGEERTNIKTGHGGIRDIEFVTQFLQLLNGGTSPDVRSSNTFEAIGRLQLADILSMQEAQLLIRNYGWLRKLEHRLQIMFDLQTHTLPESTEELEKVARRMGYRFDFGSTALEQFQNELLEITSVNHKILDHLLHQGFGSAEDGFVAPVVDLVLDPNPSEEMIERTLKPFGIQDPARGYLLLQALADEKTPFLSSRRCRHFLASIADQLLTEIGLTPDPDTTLRELSSVTDSIGAKAVLWELFRFQPNSLHLFIRLCASSGYLTEILRRRPGMIDDLVDSLWMERLPSREWLQKNLETLLRGAAEPAQIIHSFKKAMHLRVGIRDILGRDPVRETHRALSDIAQVCLGEMTNIAVSRVSRKYTSLPLSAVQVDEDHSFVILGLGKIGGHEPNYHSDIDVIFLFDNEGRAANERTTSDQHFYSEIAAFVTRAVTTAGRDGRLYEMDSRLRPTGQSGSLAVSFSEFQRYFASGSGALWERQALCKARPIYGRMALQKDAMRLVHEAIRVEPWQPANALEIRKMRYRMQEGCSQNNLKRGIGGTVDVEFLIQMLQMKHANQVDLLVPGTLDAIDALESRGILASESARQISSNYEVLRGVESRLRLMNTAARHDLPEAPAELARLAFLLRLDDVTELLSRVKEARRSNREIFEAIFDQQL
ncbi:MAG: bifunctional [glutamate--ammonia ligase]-adenylyl-L-tyrosine phosphorylase/[glutamate--ammonia-ligase] adenylyltransferase [Mariniblastus sp.]|nr:bifunctional [glutamate--ammonia ligase]-adenylyl-L-tyrosine phosphorylase/[glutamate--ammonia-ligase] adenylyltransferase [Mariniblastus sp.]